jgi:hypothetical protein
MVEYIEHLRPELKTHSSFEVRVFNQRIVDIYVARPIYDVAATSDS